MDKMFIDVIKHRDAYKLLYTFLMENCLLSTYCRRVKEFRLRCGDTNIPTNCKDVLYGVLERYLNTYEDTLEFFPARYNGAFRWADTPEGIDFWGEKHDKWLKFLTNRKISKYTRIDRAKA
jgi:hypothetical protein